MFGGHRKIDDSPNINIEYSDVVFFCTFVKQHGVHKNNTFYNIITEAYSRNPGFVSDKRSA